MTKRKISAKQKNFQTALSIGDVIVHPHDHELLTGPYWINDVIISFIFQYYRGEIYRNQLHLVSYIPPDITQIIKMLDSDEEIAQFIAPLRLEDKDLMFFPINDNDQDEAGGTHWSLLVFNKHLGRFTHYDSQEIGRNFEAARMVAIKLQSALNVKLKSENMTRSNRRTSSNQQLLVDDEDFPKQENEYDCGLYVIMAVTILSELYRSPNCGLSLADIKPQSIVFLRKEIRSMLERLWLVQQQRKEQEAQQQQAVKQATSSSSSTTTSRTSNNVTIPNNVNNNSSSSPVNSSSSSTTTSNSSTSTRSKRGSTAAQQQTNGS